jgi:hypothetical protein
LQRWIKPGRRACSLNDYDTAQLNQDNFSFAMPLFEEEKEFPGKPVGNNYGPFHELQGVKS